MIAFFKSSDNSDKASLVTIMGVDKIHCIKTAFKYWNAKHFKGVPVAIQPPHRKDVGVKPY